MCTLTFVPRDSGYVVAMNRDEALTRRPAFAPRLHDLEGGAALFPYELGGGTWIAANDHGIVLALLNWHVPHDQPKKRSRGEVIPALIAAPSSAEIHERLSSFDLGGCWPFRLIGFFLSENSVREWRWSAQSVEALELPWERRNWFSSGASDEKAELVRGAVFEKAWQKSSAETLAAIRRLHRSHEPARGAFSICVHRETVETRSYTEVVIDAERLTMRYAEGRPCEFRKFTVERSIRLAAIETRVQV